MMLIVDSVKSHYSPLATIGFALILGIRCPPFNVFLETIKTLPHRRAYSTPCYIALNL